MSDHKVLVERLNDLIVQATTERSHYYTARVLKETRAAIEQLVRELARSRQSWEVERTLAFGYQERAEKAERERDEALEALREATAFIMGRVVLAPKEHGMVDAFNAILAKHEVKS